MPTVSTDCQSRCPHPCPGQCDPCQTDTIPSLSHLWNFNHGEILLHSSSPIPGVSHSVQSFLRPASLSFPLMWRGPPCPSKKVLAHLRIQETVTFLPTKTKTLSETEHSRDFICVKTPKWKLTFPPPEKRLEHSTHSPRTGRTQEASEGLGRALMNEAEDCRAMQIKWSYCPTIN